MGDENPLTIHEISAAQTPSDSRSDWASEPAAAKQAEVYEIKLKMRVPVHPISVFVKSFLLLNYFFKIYMQIAPLWKVNDS